MIADSTCGFSIDLFPLTLSSLFGWPWRGDRDLSKLLRKFENSSTGVLDPITMVKRAIPKSVPMKVTEIIPRLKDGGAFVKFNHPPEISPTEIEGSEYNCLLHACLFGH